MEAACWGREKGWEVGGVTHVFEEFGGLHFGVAGELEGEFHGDVRGGELVVGDDEGGFVFAGTRSDVLVVSDVF